MLNWNSMMHRSVHSPARICESCSMLRLGLLLMMAVGLTGCLPQVDTSPADAAIERWIGQPVRYVLNSWGPPSRSEECGDSQKLIYQASHYDRRSRPANLDPNGFSVRNPLVTDCRGIIGVDGTGTVVTAEWVGEECWR